MTPLCSGPISRRTFLRAGTLALGGLTLSDLMAARAGTSAQDTSVILVWLWGGPSQFETWDPKPDAPPEIRGPFRPIRTAVPGMDFCELFPRQAAVARRLAVVRSLHHTMSSHNDGSIEVLTGKTPVVPDATSTAKSEHPDFGMVASRWRGIRPDGLPQYVGVPRAPFMTRPTYLGLGYQGFTAGDPSVPGFAPPGRGLVNGVNPDRLGDRRTLLGDFDRMRRDLDRAGSPDGTDPLRSAAFQILTGPGMARAFDLSKEDDRLRDRYGRHQWGQSCLLARRLAEAGSAVVTLDFLAPEPGKPIYFSWDDHADAQPGWDLARGMRWRAPFLDQALTALIDDVYDRGLDDRILIVACGEFGRTPKISTNNGNIGRDHWPDAMTALLSGGGLNVGQVVGATDSKGGYPKDRPLTPQDLLATMYRHLGVDRRHEFKDLGGRPIPILSSGEPIRELV